MIGDTARVYMCVTWDRLGTSGYTRGTQKSPKTKLRNLVETQLRDCQRKTKKYLYIIF